MRKLLFAIIFIGSISGLNAQNLGLGLRVGPNISTLLSKEELGKDALSYVVGGQAEVFFYKMVNKTAGFEVGLMYSRTGFHLDLEIDDEDDPYTPNYTGRMSYLSIPISMRFKFKYFTLNPGFKTSLLLNYDQKSEVFEHKDEMKSTDFSFFISPGFQFPKGFTFNTTVCFGTVEISENLRYVYVDHRSFSWQFSAGYTFLRRE